MSLNSSISSSEARASRRYLAILAVGVVCLILGNVGLSAFGIRSRSMTWYYTQLLRYQFDKLSRSHDVKTLLIGDSSLGNAIDARGWSGSLGEQVLSLALTGNYGYGGSLNMLRNALPTQPVHTVVVFQHVQLMTSPATSEGMVLTANHWSDLDLVSFSAVWSTAVNLSTAVNVLGTLLRGDWNRTSTFAAVDYAPQTVALPEVGNERPLTTLDPKNIVADHERYLMAIGRVCAAKRLRCLYVHGPLTNSVCVNSGAFVAAVNRIVSRSGLIPVKGSPVCMPWEHTGDTENHVRPQFKSEYSARYLALLRPYFVGEEPPMP